MAPTPRPRPRAGACHRARLRPRRPAHWPGPGSDPLFPARPPGGCCPSTSGPTRWPRAPSPAVKPACGARTPVTPLPGRGPAVTFAAGWTRPPSPWRRMPDPTAGLTMGPQALARRVAVKAALTASGRTGEGVASACRAARRCRTGQGRPTRPSLRRTTPSRRGAGRRTCWAERGREVSRLGSVQTGSLAPPARWWSRWRRAAMRLRMPQPWGRSCRPESPSGVSRL
mmetsp:Transcript_4104/g.17212  ORF Transcript_4104/g.17212 Transcript_4104/m.17212 type:complete len:227 (-) Transcript_4104:647-1327(-)